MADLRFAQIAAYFARPEHHRDDDRRNVSLDELAAARPHLPAAAQRVVDALLTDSGARGAVRGLEREGRINDRQISLRDLYAMARGTSYSGGDNSAKRSTVVGALAEANRRLRRLDDTSRLPREAVARVGYTTYVIDAGHIYARHASGASERLPDSADVRALVSYRGQLVAMQNDGDIFLWGAKQREWLSIGSDGVQLLTDGDSLVARTDNNQLWVYRGTPGDWEITLTPMSAVGANGQPTINMVPMVAGREFAFTDSGMRDVVNIANRADGAIVIKLASGENRVFAR
jgi:hypothetical protein